MFLFYKKTMVKCCMILCLVFPMSYVSADMLDLYMMGVLPSISKKKVVDTEKPNIRLNGDSEVYLLLNDSYNELGAICTDNIDKSCSVVIGGDEVNTAKIGTYIVAYNATDASSNHADEVIRTVQVEDPAYVPDTFTFTDEVGVEYNQWFSSSITVSGLATTVEVSISSSGYEGQESHSSFTVNDQSGITQVENGDIVEVKHLSSNQDNTTLNTVISIGSKSDTFSTTTKANSNVKIPLIVGSPDSNTNVHEQYSYVPQLSTDYSRFAPTTKPFTIENRPVWAQFDTATGELSGTATIAGTHHNIKISAYGDNGMDSIVFDLEVSANPPSINGYGLSLDDPDLVLTFNDNADWRSKVTKVTLRSCYSQQIPVLLNPSDYTFAEGTLTLHASVSQNVALHIPIMGGGNIEVEATGYETNSTGLIDMIDDGQYAVKATWTADEALTEFNVNQHVLTVSLSNYLEFEDTALDSVNFNTWDSDIVVSHVVYISPVEANVTLSFNGNDFDSNKTLTLSISADELNMCQDISTNQVNVAAIIETEKNILKTGVTQSFITGDDASTNKGQDRSYAYTDNVDSNPIGQDIVRDNITGLQWQDNKLVTLDDYASYPGDNNWTKAKNYCDALSLHGYGDWRLPNNEELLTLVDYGKFDLAVDNIFNHFGSILGHPDNYGYWSSVEHSTDSRFAWVIGYEDGELHFSGKISQYNAKCVRGNLTPNQFRRDTNGIVYDASTNLKWQDNVKGAAGTFAYAIEYCDELVVGTETNWRLPNINELLTITDYEQEPINIVDIFENTSSFYHYSSTKSETNSSKSWFILFENGGGTYELAEGQFRVRCVSDDNPPAHPTAWLSILNGTDSDGDADHITVGVELNGTTFTDNSVILIQQNGVVSATNGYVYVDATHAYIIENIENLTQDEPLSWTIHESETVFDQKITTNTITIDAKSTAVDPVGTVTVGDLMWEDTAHTRSQEMGDLLTWQEASDYCEALELGEFSNWRLSHSNMNSGSGESEAEVIAIRIEAEEDTDNTIMEGFTPVYQSEFITTWTDEQVSEGLYMAMIFQYFIGNGDAFSDSDTLNVRCVRDK